MSDHKRLFPETPASQAVVRVADRITARVFGRHCVECDAEIDIPQPNGTPVCTPCWAITPRLERMLRSWEPDVYAQHRNAGPRPK